MSLNRCLLCGCLVPALLLAGCTPTDKGSAAQSQPPQATAPAVAETTPAPAAQAQPPQPSPEEQRLHRLIQQVEAAYARGEADYRKGQLPEAKTEFDHAVDLMLGSGLDIRATPELSDEFDRIVDKVNGLEMDALKQGNGFAPQVEPSPSDVAGDVTFAVDPNLVAKATADLATTKSDLPLVMNDYVAAFINFFANTQKGHNTLLHSFQRSGRYRAMIQRVMAEEGVPQDLIYLAVAESGFQPRAVNPRSRAGGIWQFMPTGQYGLAKNNYLDERFDPEKSTRAYARYMKFLYDQLGDWYLAMAAYDWGAGNVQRAVEKTGYADFWELYKRHNLPGETQNYVPEILAAIIIANHPTQYGFDDITLDPPVLTDTVTVNYSIDLRLVSDLVGAPVDEIEALNPSLLHMETPAESPYDLHLPAGTAALFDQRVEAIPEGRRNSWRYHALTADDTLASVAHEYRVQPEELAAANQMSESASLQSVEALVVPVAPEATPAAHTVMYTVRRGDTLVTIADRFGVSLAQLRQWNSLTGTRVEPGKRIHVAEPAPVRRVAASEARRRPARSASAGDPKTAGTQKSGAKTGEKTGTRSKSRVSHKRSDAAKSTQQK
jgi:membrane-bound lytic murein transglycosylase D